MSEQPEDPGDRLRRLLESEDETLPDLPTDFKKQDFTPSPQPRPGSASSLIRPALDSDNMPLPRRVDEIDMDGTRVTPAAYEPTTSRRPRQFSNTAASGFNLDLNNINWRKSAGCLVRGLIVMAFVGVITGLCLGSVALYQYYSIARALPAVGDLRERASQFETTRILDRNGNLLYEILDPSAGRRTYV
ncbi:MAG: hypothetical protein ACREUU_08485, partial [Gammaproteobacteria bacterium]